MLFILSLLFGLIPNEIHIANSVDWLCYQSGTVATVKVNNIKEESFKLMDYESSITIDATIQHVYKGSVPISKEVIVYSRLTYVGMDKWKNMVGKEVLVFLQNLMCERQCAYGIWDDDRGVIDLEHPGEKALTGDFKVLKNKEEIFSYGADCIEKLDKKSAKQAYLEVPYETEAFGALYEGSACYLIVPDVLYPKATNGMH